MENNFLEQEQINFTVDAGIINRLGKELVGRSETAVSELVKNAYDADANLVSLNFVDTNTIGGTLIIEDDGNGMTREQLINGFMRIASADKIDNPRSPIYDRFRAGRKGIGRFATQRLGNKLTIITETKSGINALKVTIDWTKYGAGIDIESIYNTIELVEKTKEKGTTLIIDELCEKWTTKNIEKVFRFVSNLLQPNYLSPKGEEIRHATLKIRDKQEIESPRNYKKENTFEVVFYSTKGEITEVVSDIDETILEQAVAIIEGRVDEKGAGFVSIKSDRFSINDVDEKIEIGDEKQKIKNGNFDYLNNVRFKVYYFIYQKIEYYTGMQSQDLSKILELSKTAGGIRLYRNGFRVLPYGETGNDWLNIEAKGKGRGGAYAPFSNNNFFGFVELIDEKGELFEETSSREGLLENEAFDELTYFLLATLDKAVNRVHASRKKEQDEVRNKEKKEQENKLKELSEAAKDLSQTLLNSPDVPENIKNKAEKFTILADSISSVSQKEIDYLMEEIAMLRVLAGLGLIVGEFTHEIRRFPRILNSNITVLLAQNLNEKATEVLKRMADNVARFKAYTAYFDTAVSKNAKRELTPLELHDIINDFLSSAKAEASKSYIAINTAIKGYNLYTCPMHLSEWGSILWNLYTNAKKAIRRAQVVGKINLVGGEENGKIYLEFSDNGDGISTQNSGRIFDAFFTTSNIVDNSNNYETMTGTGLGLKIVKDIITYYKGNIALIPAKEGYKTCFRIEVPKATKQQLIQK